MRKRCFYLSVLYGIFLSPVSAVECHESHSGFHATIAAYAMDLETGQVIVDIQADQSLIPASCIKVATTGAALHILGPDTLFYTTLEIDGDVKQGVLNGNLWIHGGGDPCLGAGRTPSSLDWKQQIETWADCIIDQGIRVIQGEVLGDASLWEQARAVPSWAWEDVGNYYGAGASALSFNENTYWIYFSPGPKEGDATILGRIVPPIADLTLQSEVTTGAVGSGDRACIYGSEFSTVHHIQGTIPAGVSEFCIKGAIPNPARLCANLLCDALQKRGVKIQHVAGLGSSEKSVIHTTVSPKVEEIVYWTNQKSIDLYAEHLLKSLGEKVYQDGSTSSGVKAVLEFWKKKGMDIGGMHIADGSGISRKNFITAKQLVLMMQTMKQSPYFSSFYRSLPEVQNGVRAKSGSMSFIRGYVGYKGNIAFAILINHCSDTPFMRQKLHQFMSELPLK